MYIKYLLIHTDDQSNSYQLHIFWESWLLLHERVCLFISQNWMMQNMCVKTFILRKSTIFYEHIKVFCQFHTYFRFKIVCLFLSYFTASKSKKNVYGQNKTIKCISL